MAGGYTNFSDQPPLTPEEEAAGAAAWERYHQRVAEERRRADAIASRYPHHVRLAANAHLSGTFSGQVATGHNREHRYAAVFGRPSTAAAIFWQRFSIQTGFQEDEETMDDRQEAEDDCQENAGTPGGELAGEEHGEALGNHAPSEAPSSPLSPAPSSSVQEQHPDDEHLPSQPQLSEPSPRQQSQEAQPTNTAAQTEVWARTAPNQPLGPRPPDHSRWYYVTEPALGKRKEEDRPIVEGKRKRKPKKSFGDP